MMSENFCFKDANILVMGDLALDTYWHTSIDRISPEAPVPVSKYQNSEYRLAGAAHVAVQSRLLGANVELISIIGNADQLEQDLTNKPTKLTSLLDSYNIVYNLLPMADKTSGSIRIVSQSQQLLKVDEQLPLIDKHKLEQLYQLVLDKIKDYDTVIFYDSGHEIFDSNYLKSILDACKNNNIKSVYFAEQQDTIKNLELYQCQTDYLIVNKPINLDVNNLLNKVNHGVFMIDVLSKSKGIKYLSKSDSESRDSLSLFCKTLSEVDNIIGVRETVTAMVGLGVSCNNHHNFISKLAVSAMSIVLMKFGQAILHAVELQLAFAHFLLEGQYNLLKLKHEIEAARNKGQKIVFANGCFDVLHIGHIAYLDAASKRGDKLFVAINSDDSISRLKGADRPVNKLKDRMYTLSSLHCVDWVVPFFTDTPEDFLKWLQPDFLIKGGDYTVEQVVGKDIVFAYGGEVEVIKHPYTEISSTKIIKNQCHTPA